VKVLVIGAGPVGATTALLLARYGTDIALFERETSFGRVFRGEGLMPLGIDTLFEMGLGERSSPCPVAGWSRGTSGSTARRCSSYPSPSRNWVSAPCASSTNRLFSRRWSSRLAGTRLFRSSGGHVYAT
jgi:2-polyprenyl-6-methoxyphenol hydroxylase-like FAD-dependent oxidoreductase